MPTPCSVADRQRAVLAAIAAEEVVEGKAFARRMQHDLFGQPGNVRARGRIRAVIEHSLPECDRTKIDRALYAGGGA